MPTISRDPATGRLTLDGQVLDRTDPRMWGSVGQNIMGPTGTRQDGDNMVDAYDPRWWMQSTRHDGDVGEVPIWQHNQATRDRLNGRVQLRESGVGGPGEVIDPSLVEWDDELGILTHPSNIRAPELSGFAGFMDSYGLPIMTALAGGLVASHSGLFGAMGGAGGSGGVDLGAFGGLAPEEALGAGWGNVAGSAPAGIELPGLMEGMAPYSSPSMLPAPNVMGGVGGAGSLAGAAGAGGGGGAAPGGVGPMAEMGGAAGPGAAGPGGGGSLLSRAGDFITSNPGTLLRGIGGLAAMGAGSRSGGSANAVGSMSDILEQQANANRYDWRTPYGSRSWERGADGRWTVTDAMSPEEQANYEGVRDLNAGATSYARDLLARTMAAPRRDYFGSLPATDSYFGRWRG